MQQSDLLIGLASWIISDGNYEHFRNQSDVAFALEFYPPSGLQLADANATSTPTLAHVEDCFYSILGKVIHATDDWWAVDCGVGIYRKEVPPDYARVGNWVSGDIYLGVDPFFYFERLAGSLVPPLIYDWHVDKIEVQTAPYIDSGRGYLHRDRTRWAWKEIPSTDVWSGVDGSDEYLLHCRRIDGAPRWYK